MTVRSLCAALAAAISFSFAAPAFADGEIQITHAKALAGNVTPGDTAGYPVTISIPGTFELASNLFVAANAVGIQVTGASATIDLNGFKMEGSDVAFHGIAGGADAVTIENGTITGFKFDGIVGTGDFWIVRDVRVVENGRHGIRCGLSCLVESSVVSANGALGIIADSGMVIGNVIADNVGSAVQGNTGVGFGNNTLILNNGGSTSQTAGNTAPVHVNLCRSTGGLGPCSGSL